MNTFNWTKAVVFGVLIWAAMFLLVWATISMAVFSSVWAQLALALVAGVLTYLFAMNVKAAGMNAVLGYGVAFVAIGIVLDLIISQRLVSGLFNLWTYYLAYAVILFAPSVELALRDQGHISVTR